MDFVVSRVIGGKVVFYCPSLCQREISNELQGHW